MAELSTRDVDRRARLLAIKLRALVREHTGVSDGDLRTEPFPLGAAVVAGRDTWVLLDEPGPDARGLGGSLIWAARTKTESLHIVAETATREATREATGVLARRASEFSLPITVWGVDGRRLTEAEPAPFPPLAEPSPSHLRFVADIAAAGAAPVIEHGVVTGEVRGLEVCRVVDAEGPEGPIVRLEVGAGVHDREAFAIVHGDVPTHEALAGVVASVAAVRDVGCPAHPLNRLAPERFLRWRLEQEPWLVDLASVEPASPPVPRRSLKDRRPCSARGWRLDGTPVVVVCSIGVDLDLIPYAADARLAALAEGAGEPGVEGNPKVLVALPPRDLVPATQELAGLLRHSVTLVTVSADRSADRSAD